MHAKLLLPMALIPSLLLLPGCGNDRPVIALPPLELTSCAGEPDAPELPAPGVERDRLVLEYLLALRDAWGDCASRVAGLKSWRETAAN